MEIKQVAKIAGGQDGAIFGSELFRFDHRGNCTVYDIADIERANGGEVEPLSRFVLDRADVLTPHSNAVCFGCERYDPSDRYPLLYTNIYNNYAGKEDPMLGVTCVYRIWREGDRFASALVQLIQIDFCENAELWRASPERHGVRPYGNMTVDPAEPACYAFVMRNEERGTRYFKFHLPSVRDGEYDKALGVRVAVLSEKDILSSVDCPYHRYIQGAAFHRGRIYSTEGFTDDAVNRPAIRIVDPTAGEERYIDIMEMGFTHEPEFIDFYGDTCYYSDLGGNLFSVEF